MEIDKLNEEFIPIDEAINKHIKKEEFEIFQVQGEKNSNMVNIVSMGKYESIPMVPIYNINYDGFICQMMSFMITIDEIDKEYYNMIGLLIFKNNNVIGSLNFVFIKDNNQKGLNNIIGKFEIIFITKGNIESIRSYNNYPGSQESIHILTEVLVEENVTELCKEIC